MDGTGDAAQKGPMTLTDRKSGSTTLGAAWAMAAVFCFSVNDVVIKLMSGGYALHEIVLIRSLIGLAVVLGVIVPLSGGLRMLRTRRLGAHILRGLFVVFANLCFFLGLAALPLAEAVAIFFVCPLLISAASVLFLGETVGPRRWAAIAVGLVGVLVVLRPGTAAFQPASLLPLAAAFGYAGLHTLTRRIGGTEGGAALAFYVQVTFLVTSLLIGLALGDGRFAGSDQPSLAFLFRAWTWPIPGDRGFFVLVGITSAFGGYAIGRAYQMSEAALVAPFEYSAMPLAIFWGALVFGEVPDAVALVGIALILAAGLVLVWREAAVRRARPSRPPAHR